MANHEQLKKGVGKCYRIEPYLLEFTDAGVDRGVLDDAWKLVAATDGSFTLQHRDLGFEITLGTDSFVAFNRDPERDAKLQAEGVFVLKVQVYKYRGVLGAVSTPAPGRQYRDFTPPPIKTTLADVARADAAKKELEEKQARFLADGRSLADALRSFDDIPALVREHVDELKKSEGIDVPVQVITRKQYTNLHAIWCNGWWFTLVPQQIGNIEQLRLEIVQWKAIPRFPGFLNYGNEEPRKKWVRQYRLTQNGARWSGDQVPPQTARDIAEWLLMVALRDRGTTDRMPEWGVIRTQ
jgi:hypothetical protein